MNNTTDIWIIGITFFSTLIGGLPVAFCLGIAGVIIILLRGFPIVILAQRMFTGIDSFIILAIPFFMWAGVIMQKGKISQRLTHFADAIVGSVRGGLAHVGVLAAMFFGGCTGAGSADSAAIASILLKPMEGEGYSKKMISPLLAISGSLGAIIPPSLPMVIFGAVTGVSIGKLFLGGIIPGIMMGASIMVVNYFIATNEKLPAHKFVGWKELFRSFIGALLPLGMPFIIVGGIYGGIFTPTEAAAVAVIYCLIITVLLLHTVRWRQFIDSVVESVAYSSVPLFLIAIAGFIGWLLSWEQIPQVITNELLSVLSSKFVFLLVVNLLLLFVGCFLEGLAAILVIIPLIFPVAMSLGIDPIHFGLIVVVNLTIGMSTPPVGLGLFVCCSIANVKIEETWPYLKLYLLVAIVDLLLITYIPQITLFLPNLLYR